MKTKIVRHISPLKWWPFISIITAGFTFGYYKNIFIIGLAMAITGCMPKNKITTKNFTATESICIDGVIVNIDAAGCSDMSTTKTDGEPGIKMRCEDMDQSNSWTFLSFHIVPTTMDIDIPAWNIVCSDPSATIYYSVPNTN